MLYLKTFIATRYGRLTRNLIYSTKPSEDREKRLWDNVGFATDKGITWVDKYRMRDILNVPSEDYSTYSAAYIYEQISHKRKEFISPILKESKALQSQSRINKASGED
ncbi:hypothetical protein [Klebsiella pneumoniae]|uniref:hypothetical protein n=1 Tax=Klebsiella pneumoniae TaxID=573 RepID=UPI003F8F05F0